MPSAPYKSTPVFDETTLPAALRQQHSTKAGVWGVIRVLEGRLRLTYVAPASTVELGPNQEAVVQPQQVHFVEPLGAVKMQVDFHDQPPGD